MMLTTAWLSSLKLKPSTTCRTGGKVHVHVTSCMNAQQLPDAQGLVRSTQVYPLGRTRVVGIDVLGDESSHTSTCNHSSYKALMRVSLASYKTLATSIATRSLASLLLCAYLLCRGDRGSCMPASLPGSPGTARLDPRSLPREAPAFPQPSC